MHGWTLVASTNAVAQSWLRLLTLYPDGTDAQLFALLISKTCSGIDKLDSLEFCRWFTWGWTLQELIGSQNLEFHDSAWQHRGTKSGLRDRISDITRIDITVLKNNKFLKSILIDKRISWAINRKTTRIEDLSYCLISIFDINMPMMYGEGTEVFERLQEAIIKETTDMSIFA